MSFRQVGPNLKRGGNGPKLVVVVEDWEHFKCQQKVAKYNIKKAKVDYERKLAENINTDAKEKYIKRKCIVKDYVGPLEDGNGGVIMGNSEMAEALNQYFVSVFTV